MFGAVFVSRVQLLQKLVQLDLGDESQVVVETDRVERSAREQETKRAKGSGDENGGRECTSWLRLPLC